MADPKIAAAEKAVRMSLSRNATIVSGVIFALGVAGYFFESGNDFGQGVAAGVASVGALTAFIAGVYHEDVKHNR